MTEIRCSHIILKHTSSRNPVCRRTGATITRSPEEAESELRTIRESFVMSPVINVLD